jgi:hypothetical protein
VDWRDGSFEIITYAESSLPRALGESRCASTNQPTLGIFDDNHLLSSQLQHDAALKHVVLGIKVLYFLADSDSTLNRVHPAWIVQHPVNRRAHAVEIERRGAAERIDDFRKVHALYFPVNDRFL